MAMRSLRSYGRIIPKIQNEVTIPTSGGWDGLGRENQVAHDSVPAKTNPLNQLGREMQVETPPGKRMVPDSRNQAGLERTS